ncbi:MAG: glycosyltransferase [Actinobacteria bacterium]|nr:glycosyltransferase [Actinomycetota bacterium]NBY16058.1 glycosyltransferase [Actinomycetota bacterium]
MALNYSHLISLTDTVGIFEHAKYNKARLDHGYCVDDVARALLLIERNQPDDSIVLNLRHIYFDFLRQAQSPDGAFINRRDIAGNWNGEPEVSDHWGRALWALGAAFAYDQDRDIAYEALQRFELGVQNRSAHLRSMLFASLGASTILEIDPDNQPATRLLRSTTDRIDALSQSATPQENWPWPEPRLTYANAILPEVLILAGTHLDNSAYLTLGIELLSWLLKIESAASHFSVTPTNGYGPTEQRSTFDQQPIEIAALVDACSSAYKVTNDPVWLAYIARGANWFSGSNDSKTMMYDPLTGAGFDGLTATGRNHNRGAESTIAYLSVMDQYQRQLMRQHVFS